MAGFQQTGPAADVSKSLYGKINFLCSAQANSTLQYGCVPVCLRKKSTVPEKAGFKYATHAGAGASRGGLVRLHLVQLYSFLQL